MTKKENNIVLFSITLCWAASYIFIKSLPKDLSSYAYLTLTTGIAAIIMSVVFFKRLNKIRKGTLWKGFFLALLMCANLLAERAGISLLSSSNASFISSLNIIFVPLLMLLFKKFPSRNNVAGIIVILAGIFCTNGFQLEGFLNFGTFYMMAACFVMGIYTIAADRFAKEEDPLLMAVVQMMFTALMGYLLWCLEEPTTFLSLTYSPGMVSSIIIVNNFMRCHRFDLVRCRKPTRFPVTGPIVYTIIHLPVYGSFLDSFLHSAASNYLTSLDAAFCILAGNCAQAIHNSQAGRPVYPGQPAFFCSLMKLSALHAHFA